MDELTAGPLLLQDVGASVAMLTRNDGVTAKRYYHETEGNLVRSIGFSLFWPHLLRASFLHFHLPFFVFVSSLSLSVPTGSPSRDGDVAVYVLDINQSSLPTPFHSALVSVSVFMALSTYFIP